MLAPWGHGKLMLITLVVTVRAKIFDPRKISTGRSKSPKDNTLMELLTAGMPHHRTIVALDIEHSTSRPDPVKAELRNKLYDLFNVALRSYGIKRRYRDPFIDRGDGILALMHPVNQVPKALLLNNVFPALNQLLSDHNANLPHPSQSQRQLRVRVVLHAGEVYYDAHGCFGEALDVAFRLLDAGRFKKALQLTPDSLALIVSGDIYKTVVRHYYGEADQQFFYRYVRVQIAGNRYPGWIYASRQSQRRQVTEMASYRLPA